MYLDVNGAAARLSGLLGEQSLPPSEEAPEAQEEQAQEHEAVLSEDEAEQETLDSDTEAEPNLHKVKVDGEEVEVEYEELLKGYSREAHYQRKAKDLSKDREAIEAKWAEVDKQLEDAKTLLDDQLSALNSPEMLELKEYDPEKYLKKFDEIQGKVKKFEELKAKRQSEHDARMEKLVEKERKALFDAFPAWSDQKVMTEESAQLIKTLSGLGFTDQEVSGITDHRMFVMASRIQQLEKIQKANLEAKKVKTSPKNMRPGTPESKQERATKDTKGLRSKLKKSGKLQDAVNLLMNS